jgi:hypothetical protein
LQVVDERSGVPCPLRRSDCHRPSPLLCVR